MELTCERLCMSVETFEAYFRGRINRASWSIVCWGDDKRGIKEDNRVLPQMNSWIVKNVIEIGVMGG